MSASPRSIGLSLTLVRETTIVLGLTLFLPFMVHLLPSWDDSPLGAHLLPIFYAPLAALILGRLGVALAASFLAPWVNYLLTGNPLVPMALLLCLQLVLFLLAGEFMLKRKVPPILIGPAGYVLALAVSGLLGNVLHLGDLAFPIQLSAVPVILLRAIPGVAILALIGFWFGRHKPLGA